MDPYNNSNLNNNIKQAILKKGREAGSRIASKI